MSKTTRATVLCVALLGALSACAAAGDSAAGILEATGVRGGLVVHLGCGDGTLTAALRANSSYLVHGLDTDPDAVKGARALIHSKRLYGPVSVDLFDGERLPYADDLVNLLVAESPGRVTAAEIDRVLAPGGVAYIRTDGAWRKTVKPRPDSIDEWTHYLHDASNDGVARDTRVGPPRRMQWVSGPLWTRSHEYTSSLVAMVSGGGRVFYIFDEGLTGVTPPSLPELWKLIARDAFNGVLLWKRPVLKWRAGRWGSRALRSVPPSSHRLLVVEGDRVFVPSGVDAPVSILDAATGKVLATCAGTEKAQELRCLDGVLLVRSNKGLAAFDATTGARLWRGKDNPLPQTLAAQGGKVFYRLGGGVACLELRTGKELWRTAGASSSRPAGKPAGKPAGQPARKSRRSRKPSGGMLVACGERVLFTGGKGLEAISADTGKTVWSAKARLGGRGELFVARDQAWHWDGHRIVGRDLATGKVRTTLKTDDVFTPGHHLRCYQSKATENFMITPHRGVEFISLAGGENTQNDWVRGPCKYGIMPCNGLLYAPPDPCFCYPGVKLTGFNALAPAATDDRRPPPGERLVKGRAYDEAAGLARAATGGDRDWPTYRHDARRTGAT
ncbi:MAG: outer membrane protein assembly factor BamB family protein, partial [Planctomycetota bacterium]